MMRLIQINLVLALLILPFAGCQTLPPPADIKTYGELQLAQAHFKHLVISRQPTPSPTPTRLHVYIEGDGSPFVQRFRISADPSPRYPLMLLMMQKDPTPSIYLGRPCYFQTVLPLLQDALCNPSLWTDARYSDAVVQSMADALIQRSSSPQTRITLIGHSGGGALAVLIAPRIPQVDQVVTLAGNLDTDAWTKLHGYSKLSKSLNPAKQHPLPPNIQQIHFIGAKDDNIPPSSIQHFLQKNAASADTIPQADHSCCWLEIWPELLKKFP